MSSNEELERFRQEWLLEVKKQKEPIASSSGEPSTPVEAPKSPKASSKKTRPARSASIRLSADLKGPALSFPALLMAQEKSHSALRIYQDAVDAESSGALDDALALYRKAFKIEPDVDRIYERSLQREAAAARPTTTSTLPSLLQNLSISEKTASTSRSSPAVSLKSIIPSFLSQELRFEPEDELAPVHIERLPPELIVYILKTFSRMCDYRSIEAFASVSRKARLISLENSIWRKITKQLYRSPQIADDLLFSDIVDTVYDRDHRRALIEHPRIRLDGVYIAVCHYVRPGMGENVWIAVEHLITYHRYLRFLPDGTVLSLLANEGNPSEVIHLLDPSYRRNGFFIGSWTLEGTTVIVRDLIDPSGQFAKYGFEMVLSLKAKPLGRWNKLELNEYSTVRLDTGEGEPLPLRHQKPFWFSKVRSYDPFSLAAAELSEPALA